MDSSNKILLVEDDASMGFLLTKFLEGRGYQVKLCPDGEEGLAQIKLQQFGLSILDVMLPKMDGFTLAQHIRDINPAIPFLFLTARSLKSDKLKAFNLGADDYVTKPFDEEELLCRIKVLMRRKSNTPEDPQCLIFKIGLFTFDYAKQELQFEDQMWRLTETESEVLKLLCLHKNQILKRDKAVELIYGKKDYFLGRSFDVFISKLRKLLQADPNISIENVFKVGFILKVNS